jgi:hypothetical protein
VNPPVNPEPVPPPFNIVEAVKGQPAPANENWNHVREKKTLISKYPLDSFTNKSQLAVIMAEDSVMRTIILTLEDAQLFYAIMSRALANWNAANATNPVQAGLADVFAEVVSGHQEEAFF